MSNLIQAILNIVNNTQIAINHVTNGNNRANNIMSPPKTTKPKDPFIPKTLKLKTE